MRITNGRGDIFYTNDGTDPRLPGGAINPDATTISGTLQNLTATAAGSGWKFHDLGIDLGIDLGTAWRGSGFDDTAWLSGPAPLGFGAILDTTIATTVNAGRSATVYFRREIEIEGADRITGASIRSHADGGAIVYINGVEALRDNMPSGAVTFGTTSVDDGNEGVFDTYAIDHSLLAEGTNLIALELHNGTLSSSDLALEATRTNESNVPIPISSTTTIRARSFENGEWSALNEATFITGTPAATGDIVLSEIYYHPIGSQGETAEFLELMNVSDSPLSLAGAAFTGGISFAFDDLTMLEPGGRALLVADLATFEAIHGGGLPVLGAYQGRLDNTGERLTLSAADHSPLQSFRYDDRAPWPGGADGGGYSLTLIAPATTPDHALPQNWRTSAIPGGSPGDSDATTFQGDPASGLLDYAMAPRSPTGADLTDGASVFHFHRNLAADDVEFSIEVSDDLKAWRAAEAEFLGYRDRQGTFADMLWRLPDPTSHRQYARVSISLRD